MISQVAHYWMKKIRENRINHMIIPVFYIAYAIIMISLLIIDIKGKKRKKEFILLQQLLQYHYL